MKPNPWTTTPADLLAAQLETALAELARAELALKKVREAAQASAARACMVGATVKAAREAYREFEHLAYSIYSVQESHARVERLRR